MPAPTTLLDFWTEEVARIRAAITATGAAQAAAAQAEAAATAAVTQASRDVTDARAQVDATRKALAAIETPADAAPLLIELNDALVALRDAEAAQAIAEAAPVVARATMARLTKTAARLRASLTTAAAAQEAAGKAAARRAGWQAAAVAQPLSDVPQLATDALAASHAQAATKVEGDFPTNANADRSFLARARARRALGGQAAADAAGLEAYALAAQTTWIEATTRSADKLPALRRAFDASVAALSDFVTATPRVEGAAADLAALAARTTSPLTAAQRAELFSADAALTTAREDALVLLKARDDAQAAVTQAQRDYATALADARATDPDSTEAQLLASTPALQTLHDAVTTAGGNLVTARTNLAASLPTLQRWFATVPDALWDQLDTLDASVALLTATAAINPANLVADVTAKEAALAQAMDTASRETRIAEQIAADVAATHDVAAAADGAALRRQAAAARFVAEF